MHVKRIHDMMEKLTKCAELEFEKGVENVDTKEMGEVVDIIKDLAEAEYYAKISKAMDEAEYGEDYDFGGAYEDEMRKGYRGQPRSQSGRFMSRGDGRRSNRGRGGRRGYEEPMYYTMTPEMYREYDAEELRDMDREMGRMYYSGGSSSGGSSGSSQGGGQSSGGRGGSQGGNMGGSSSGMSGGSRGYSEGEGGQYSSRIQRDSREGRSGQSRRGYMEAKEQGKDKSEKMKNLEEYMKSMAEDLTEAIENASPEERSMVKNKLSVLTQKM